MTLKPYLKYKESGVEWLGQVPEHWEVMPLKRVAQIQNGKDYKDIEVDEGGYPVLGSGGEFARASQFLYQKESVLLGRKGTIDQPIYINEPFWVVDTMFYSVISTNACAKFVYYLSKTIRFDKYSTNTAVPSMTQEDLSSILFAIPSLKEQTAIATYLDQETTRIDELIAHKTRFIELLKEKRSALITHAVTKGLNPNAKMKDSSVEWLGRVPEHWEVKRLKFLCSITTGNKDTVDAVEDGIYPFFVRSQTVERINTYSYNGEAVLTAGDGAGVGKIFHYFNGKFDFHQRVYLFYSFSSVFAIYIYYCLLSNFYNVALDGSAKSTVDSLRLPLIQNFNVAFPPHDEQLDILNYLDQETARIDEIIQLTEQSINLIKERRSALITAAVTGKIEVREQDTVGV